MMEFKVFQESMMDQIVKLWNESVVPHSIFSSFTKESFKAKFVENPHFDHEGFVCVFEGELLLGFGCATIHNNGLAPDKTPGYITGIAVDKKYWRQGIGTKILSKLEEWLKTKGKITVRNFFANPINLEWWVPGFDKHEHPGAPAVPFNSPYYLLLANHGYNVNGQQDAYHLDLSDYELPDKVVKKLAENEKNGYTITFYDEKKHHGFDELFDALKNEGWRAAIRNNLEKGTPDPILIVQKDGEILGFTGPVFTQASGRGYLAGIGVHPKTQGLGLGKGLFCMLCHKSKLNNSTFMTLFTGAENPARNIYLYAGFKIVQSFAIMKKEI